MSKTSVVRELRCDLAGDDAEQLDALMVEERALDERVSRWMVERRVVDDVEDLLTELRKELRSEKAAE